MGIIRTTGSVWDSQGLVHWVINWAFLTLGDKKKSQKRAETHYSGKENKDIAVPRVGMKTRVNSPSSPQNKYSNYH